ncbi:nuclear transport factor 2 family protein [Bordetella genomosp. 6]|uniref:nuclear transport factor 2 family protein n=1 Tax=Bordetella genomosp. 6 TaxID=463024 RepID=UPI000A294340|nr:nuclear transport factor 2 family protein [Bordetella genomosp. 6]ARP78533.1 hypothetical protein CAL11_21410 [Bordetella genomosp. 6]
MQDDPMAGGIDEIRDRMAIQDVILKYARAIDRKDWGAVRAAFHEGATDDHGEYQGGIDGMIEWIARRHAAIHQSMHFIGNSLVEWLPGRRALVETYYQAHFTLDGEAREARALWLDGQAGGGANLIVLGRYIDVFAARPDWRVAERTNVYESVLAPQQPPSGRNPANHWSTRDRHDMYFKIRRDLLPDAP